MSLRNGETLRLGKKWPDFVIDTGVSLLYILLCMLPLTNILLSPVPFLNYALPALAMYGALRLLTGSKPGRIAGICLAVPVILVFLFLLLDKGTAHKAFVGWMSELGRAFEKLYFFEPLADTRYEVFQQPIVLMLTLLTVVAVWAFHERQFLFLPLTGYTMACFLLSYEMAGKESPIPFLLFCLLSILSYAGSVHDRRRKSGVDHGDASLGKTMMMAVPIAILTLLVTLMMPKQDQPLRWKWLDEKFNQVYTRIEQKFTHTDTEFFSLTATGFSGREHLLGGRVRPSNTFVMEVKADRRAYLRGAAYQTYTGTSWMTADPSFDYQLESQPESSQDLDETGTLFTMVPPDFLFRTDDGDAEPASADSGNAAAATARYPLDNQRPLYQDKDQADLLIKFSEGKLTDLLFPSLSMTVTYKNMTTRTVMAPLKTILPVKQNSDVLPVVENTRAVMLAPSFLSNGSQYTLNYRQPMYGDEILQKLLPLSHAGLYDDALRSYLQTWGYLTETTLDGAVDQNAVLVTNRIVAPNIVDENGKQIPNRDLDLLTSFVRSNPDPTLTPSYQKLQAVSQRAGDIRRKYTTLPESITGRTRAFADTIVAGQTSDYGKVIAIRNALRELFPYTLVTPRLPENMDFVDWFLFEQKSGYCTSFATTMTVLCRAVGIPSRYVEGYVLPDKDKKETTFKVTNKYAHAWTEVYLEGFGWLSFEPTPGYADATDFLAQSSVDMSGLVGSAGMSDMEELMRRYAENRDGGESDPGAFVPFNEHEPIPPLTLALFILGGMLALLILLNSGSMILQSVRLGRTPGRRQIVLRYLRMLKWLELAGMKLETGESLPEFSARVDNEYYFPETSFHALSELFGRVRYGAKEPSHAEVRLMKAMSRELHGQVVREIGVRRFMPLRHLILGI